jgi:hypothetical protein
VITKEEYLSGKQEILNAVQEYFEDELLDIMYGWVVRDHWNEKTNSIISDARCGWYLVTSDYPSYAIHFLAEDFETALAVAVRDFTDQEEEEEEDESI